MKIIELPRRVIVGDNAIDKVHELVKGLRLNGNALVITGKDTVNIAGEQVRRNLNAKLDIIENQYEDEIERISKRINKEKIRYIVGVGGGSIIDVSKVVAYNSKIPLISVPTAASHDGIASPRATVKGSKYISIQVNSPLGIVADTRIIEKAPQRLLSSGCADVISNYTAVLDWKLANKDVGEYYGDYAATLAMLSAEIVMHNSARIKEDIKILIEALISSGVAIGIAGSSRPCSGSEHQFSHVLDRICPNPALHGEQCGVGCIMMAYLHNADWTRVRDALKTVGAPTNAKELGIENKYIIEAITTAHTIRDRYTILRNGISESEAIHLAKMTGVIE